VFVPRSRPLDTGARDGGIQSLAISPDGSQIAMAVGDSSAVTLWSSDLAQAVGRLSGAGPVQALAFSPDGRRLASGGFSDDSIRIWDTARRELLIIVRDNETEHMAVVFTPDGRRMVSAAKGVKVWDSRDPDSRPEGITKGSSGR
jgi:WD40 repeat protein